MHPSADVLSASEEREQEPRAEGAERGPTIPALALALKLIMRGNEECISCICSAVTLNDVLVKESMWRTT